MNVQLIKILFFLFFSLFSGILRARVSWHTVPTHISVTLQWCSQFNENGTANAGGGGGGGGGAGGKSQIQIRLIVPASQCGSLIGKYT